MRRIFNNNKNQKSESNEKKNKDEDEREKDEDDKSKMIHKTKVNVKGREKYYSAFTLNSDDETDNNNLCYLWASIMNI